MDRDADFAPVFRNADLPLGVAEPGREGGQRAPRSRRSASASARALLLPRTIHLTATDPQSTTGWLGTLVTAAVKESGVARAGGENILARLSELMFVEAIRRYVETLPPDQTGWLAGLRDPVVGQAPQEYFIPELSGDSEPGALRHSRRPEPGGQRVSEPRLSQVSNPGHVSVGSEPRPRRALLNTHSTSPKGQFDRLSERP
jgi:hypothetical protein